MILHLCFPSKFLTKFLTFVYEDLSSYEHKFLFVSTEKQLKELDRETWEFFENNGSRFEFRYYADETSVFVRNARLLRDLYGCKKIIIHGLFIPERIAQILCYAPLLLNKVFWLMWGGDFYFPDEQKFLQKKLIRRIKYLVTYIPGDIEYVVKNYQAAGTPVECLGYPSNVFQPASSTAKTNGAVRIQVGNSATSTNRHEEVFEKLLDYRDQDIVIICPLSYGEDGYAERVQRVGREMFGEKFVSLTDFLPHEEYIKRLESIDIAIFNHDRQQGMGNIITHLGLGHKVYLRSDQSPWRVFVEKGIEVHDILEGIDLEHDVSLTNQQLVTEHFSLDRLVQQWKAICDT